MKAQLLMPTFLLSERRELSNGRKNTAILIRNSSRRIYYFFLLILFDTTSRIMGGCTNQRLAPPSGNLSPPRISSSCPHCLRLWLDSEYRMVVSLRNSLPELLLAGWEPLVTLLGRLSCRISAQVSLRAPAASLSPLVRGPPTDVVSCRICSFQDARGGYNPPHFPYR